MSASVEPDLQSGSVRRELGTAQGTSCMKTSRSRPSETQNPTPTQKYKEEPGEGTER